MKRNPIMIQGNDRKYGEDQEAVEEAAEQFAELFWKQWLYLNESKRAGTRNAKPFSDGSNCRRELDQPLGSS